MCKQLSSVKQAYLVVEAIGPEPVASEVLRVLAALVEVVNPPT
tara:strand:+ start:535 stop:663 length:129 start_codon:yes stop_codon:yes gene_type:complete